MIADVTLNGATVSGSDVAAQGSVQIDVRRLRQRDGRL